MRERWEEEKRKGGERMEDKIEQKRRRGR